MRCLLCQNLGPMNSSVYPVVVARRYITNERVGFSQRSKMLDVGRGRRATLVDQYNVVSVFDAAALVENSPGSQTGTGDNTWKDLRLTTDYIHPSGGALNSGTPGTLGSTGAGGGHATIAAGFSISLIQ